MGGDRGEGRGKERGGRSRGQMMEDLGLCTRCVPGAGGNHSQKKSQRFREVRGSKHTYFIGLSYPLAQT